MQVSVPHDPNSDLNLWLFDTECGEWVFHPLLKTTRAALLAIAQACLPQILDAWSARGTPRDCGRMRDGLKFPLTTTQQKVAGP
jgi:hypothetical protein